MIKFTLCMFTAMVLIGFAFLLPWQLAIACFVAAFGLTLLSYRFRTPPN